MIAHARRQDPIQCHIAAEKATATLTKAQAEALEWIRKHPGHTSFELEQIAQCRPGRIWKRCGELAKQGRIVRTYRQDRNGWLLYPASSRIMYNPVLFDPDSLVCGCRHIFSVIGISLCGGTVTCPKCGMSAYMPEREHYQ
jgi:hypothetical protein